MTALAILPCGTVSGRVSYALSVLVEGTRCRLAIGRSKPGNATLLVIDPPAQTLRSQRTEGLHVHALGPAVLTFGEQEAVANTVAIECLDAELESEFSALVATLIGLLQEAQEPVRTLTEELSSWRALFTRVSSIDREHEQGLWGELWVLTQAEPQGRLLEGWRGPHGGQADFFIMQRALEVKTSRRPGVVHLSQPQAKVAPGKGWLMLVPVEEDPGGKTCRELADLITANVSDPGEFLRQLQARDVACLRSDSPRRFSLLARPTLHPLAQVPRIRRADPGVHDIRYKVELPPDSILMSSAEREVLALFGLEFN